MELVSEYYLLLVIPVLNIDKVIFDEELLCLV